MAWILLWTAYNPQVPQAYECAAQAGAKMFKVDHIAKSTSASLVLTAQAAGLEDFYHSLDLSFTSSMLPEDFEAIAPPAEQPDMSNDQVQMQSEEIPEASSHSRRLQAFPSLSNILTDLSSGISTLGSFVDNAITIASLTNQAFQKQVDLGSTVNVTQLDFNYDAVAKGPQCSFSLDNTFAAEKKFNKISNSGSGDVKANMAGTCSNCFAHLGLTLDVRAKIVTGTVQNVSVVLSGSAQFQTTFDLTFNGAAQLDLKHLVATLKPSSLKFVIGAVPMVLGVVVPIYVGLNASVTGKAKITGDMGALANVRAGVQIVPDSSGTLQTSFINQLNFSRSGSGLTLQSGAADAGVRLYLLPMPNTNIDYIGGPTLGLKTYFEGIMSASTGCPISSKSLRSNIGVDGTIGADLHVLSFKKKINSLATFSQHATIKPAACSSTSGQQGRKLLVSLSDPWAQVGNVWTGQQVYTGAGRRCVAANYPPYVSASLQIIDVSIYGTGGALTLLATINSGTASLGATPYTQLKQQLYSLNYYNSGDIYFTSADSNANFQAGQTGVPGNIQFLEPGYGSPAAMAPTSRCQTRCCAHQGPTSCPNHSTSLPALQRQPIQLPVPGIARSPRPLHRILKVSPLNSHSHVLLPAWHGVASPLMLKSVALSSFE